MSKRFRTLPAKRTKVKYCPNYCLKNIPGSVCFRILSSKHTKVNVMRNSAKGNVLPEYAWKTLKVFRTLPAKYSKVNVLPIPVKNTKVSLLTDSDCKTHKVPAKHSKVNVFPDSARITHRSEILSRLCLFRTPKWDSFLTSVVDLGCLSRIPDPIFFHPGSRIQGSRIPDLDPHQRT